MWMRSRSKELSVYHFGGFREWDKQDAAGRLVVTEQAWLSEALSLTFMKARPRQFLTFSSPGASVSSGYEASSCIYVPGAATDEAQVVPMLQKQKTTWEK